LISIDTLRRDRLGIYGYANDTSPNIDRFFAAGTRYDHAVTSAPCTIPAIRQLLTGSARPLKWRKRLAEYLRDDGYRTAAFASHHLFRVGQILPREEYARGFGVFDLQPRSHRDEHGMTARGARDVTRPALEWLRANARAGRFYVWLHYFDPHDSYEPPREHRLFGGADAAEGSGDRRSIMRRAHGTGWSAKGSRHAFPPAETKLLNALYDGEVRYVDQELGRLFDALEELSLLDRTIVVLTADHGEHLGESDRWDHCSTLHGRELNVPLLLYAPGLAAAGERSHPGVVSTLDVVPTVLHMLGLSWKPETIDGIPLPESPPDRRVVNVWQEERTIQSRVWKLYASPDGLPRLFHVGTDPEEREDLATREPEVAAELVAALAREEGLAERRERTEKIVEELIEIGYVLPDDGEPEDPE
jgi:arylsulfatase